VVGYEWDGILPGCHVPALTRLFTFSGANGAGYHSEADAVRYTASSGATVFSTGTLQFGGAVDPFHTDAPEDPRVQRFMINLLNALAPSATAPSNPSGPRPLGPAPGGPSCSAAARVRRASGKHRHHARGLRLAVTIRCSQDARVMLASRITRALGPRTGTRRRAGSPQRGGRKSPPTRYRTLRLRSVTASVRAGKAVTVSIRLPRRAVVGLRRRVRESATLTVTARNKSGTRVSSFTVARLALPPHRKPRRGGHG